MGGFADKFNCRGCDQVDISGFGPRGDDSNHILTTEFGSAVPTRQTIEYFYPLGER